MPGRRAAPLVRVRVRVRGRVLRHLGVELHHWSVLDVLGARGVLQGVERLVEVVPVVSSK
eukprot:scaffold20937_cov56-Phaeocystis_antarctica.AAC.4